jgi:hypothetical protein
VHRKGLQKNGGQEGKSRQEKKKRHDNELQMASKQDNNTNTIHPTPAMPFAEERFRSPIKKSLP